MKSYLYKNESKTTAFQKCWLHNGSKKTAVTENTFPLNIPENLLDPYYTHLFY